MLRGDPLVDVRIRWRFISTSLELVSTFKAITVILGVSQNRESGGSQLCFVSLLVALQTNPQKFGKTCPIGRLPLKTTHFGGGFRLEDHRFPQ